VARPQLEDGHTRIANEILEHLMKLRLTPNQWQVLLCIIRKTYGFHKKVDYLANKQIGEATGLGKTVVSRMLHNLNHMQLITRKGKYIGFQKDWERWRKLAGQLTIKELAEPPTLGIELAGQLTLPPNKSKQDSQPELAGQLTRVSRTANKKLAGQLTTKERKETIQKKLIQKKESPKKQKYFYDNILLTAEEYQKLVEEFGEAGAKDRLETLALYKKSKGKRYASDYATILAWDKKDKKGGQGDGTHKQSPRHLRPRETYTRPEDFKT